MVDTSAAEIGYGILLKVEVTPNSGTFTTLGVQKDVKGGGWGVDAVDKGHNESPNRVKGSIPGMVSMKPWSMEIEYAIGAATVATATALRTLVRKFRLVHPSGAYLEGLAFISDFDPDMPTEDKCTASIELTPTEDFTAVAASAPTNTLPPAIMAASLGEGDTLTAYEGVWANEPTSFTYQWKNAGSNISGATSKTYDLVAGDSGDAITVAVTAINSEGSATATSQPVTAS